MLKPRVKNCHHIIQTESGDICIGDVKDRSYIFRKPTAELLSVIDKLDGTRTVARLEKEVIAKYEGVTATQIHNVLAKLNACALLEDSAAHSDILSEKELELYDRQMLYFSAIETEGRPGFHYQEKLKSQKVAVFGMGGWGTWLTLNLALAGFGTIHVVDGDTIELSNLNRQVLYTFDDVGSKKAETAIRKIKQINPFVNGESHCQFVKKDKKQIRELLGDATILFLAWANTGYYRSGTCEELIHEVAQEAGIMVVEVGGDPLDITAGPIYKNDGSGPSFWDKKAQYQAHWAKNASAETSYEDFKKARLMHALRNGNRTVNAWQTASSISAMSGLIVGEVVRVITGLGKPVLLGHRFSLSLEDFNSSIE